MDFLLNMYDKIKLLEPIHIIGLVSGISITVGVLIGLLSKKKKTTPKKTTPKKTTPNVDYGKLDTTRAKTEFGMDEEEIILFLKELKNQINEEIPEIEKYINNNDLKNLKNAVHKIKGSAVNLGENGVSKLLFDFNNYLSEGKSEKSHLTDMLEDLIYYKEKMY